MSKQFILNYSSESNNRTQFSNLVWKLKQDKNTSNNLLVFECLRAKNTANEKITQNKRKITNLKCVQLKKPLRHRSNWLLFINENSTLATGFGVCILHEHGEQEHDDCLETTESSLIFRTQHIKNALPTHTSCFFSRSLSDGAHKVIENTICTV